MLQILKAFRLRGRCPRTPFILGTPCLLGPMNRVFPTPNTGPFFPSDTDIQPKMYVPRHRHSELVTRHLTPHFSPTLTVSFTSRRQTLRKISSRHPTLRPPFMGPFVMFHTYVPPLTWSSFSPQIWEILGLLRSMRVVLRSAVGKTHDLRPDL